VIIKGYLGSKTHKYVGQVGTGVQFTAGLQPQISDTLFSKEFMT
jgi:hypothetical protein